MNLRKKIRKILFESIQNFKIEPISSSDLNEILKLCDETLIYPTSNTTCTGEIEGSRLRHLLDMDKSAKATVDGKIVGFYFLSKKQEIEDFLKESRQYGLNFKIVNPDLLETIKTKNGIQGLSIGVSDEYRKLGIGKSLMNYPKTLGFDYVWGVQTQHMSDVDQWLKRRKLLALNERIQKFWLTLEVF